MKTPTPKKASIKKQNAKCILAKDRTGRFFAIPENQAKKYQLSPNKLAEAKAFYESEVEGQMARSGIFIDPDKIVGDLIDERAKPSTLELRKGNRPGIW